MSSSLRERVTLVQIIFADNNYICFSSLESDTDNLLPDVIKFLKRDERLVISHITILCLSIYNTAAFDNHSYCSEGFFPQVKVRLLNQHFAKMSSCVVVEQIFHFNCQCCKHKHLMKRNVHI